MTYQKHVVKCIENGYYYGFIRSDAVCWKQKSGLVKVPYRFDHSGMFIG